MTDIKGTIERLEDLAEKATARPWTFGADPNFSELRGADDGMGIFHYTINDDGIHADDGMGIFHYTINDDGIHADNDADPALITELVNAFPTLTTAFKELEAERDRLREALKPFAILAEVWRSAAKHEADGCHYRYASTADLQASDLEANTAGDEAISEAIKSEWVFAAELALKP